jgi:hypothetical protein
VILIQDKVPVAFVPARAFGTPERQAEIVAYADARIAASR